MPRRLGQHFLRSASVARLLGTIRPTEKDRFLEIGPGHGALTLPLAAAAREVVAVELDRSLAENLHAHAPRNVSVVSGDALALDWTTLIGRGARLTGNLPYGISSPLLRAALDRRHHFVDAHLMVQKEVAQRIAAPPGSKVYGVLSVLFGLWADVDTPLSFPPGAFQPPPRVSSALLRIRFRTVPRAQVTDEAAFRRLVRRAFTRRRRTLENNLQDSYPNLKESLRLLHIEGIRRAETLSVEEFASLARILAPEITTRR